MGEDEISATNTASAVTMDRNRGSQILDDGFCSSSRIKFDYQRVLVNQFHRIGDQAIKSDLSLGEFSAEVCSEGLCESDSESLEKIYDDCIDCRKNPVFTKEEVCGTCSDWYNAGYVATIMLIISGIILFTATILQVRSMIGQPSIIRFVSGSGGVFIALSILVGAYCYLNRNRSRMGRGLWLAITASICGIVAIWVEHYNLG